MAARARVAVAVLVAVLVAGCEAATPAPPAPSLRHSLTAPVIKVAGEDAMLTCVVRNQGNYTVMWKRTRMKAGNTTASSRILTANMLRVTSDRRLRVMHEEGGEVYVLLISNVTSSDAGMYTCEVNYTPLLRSFHKLKVVSPVLEPPAVPRSTAAPATSEARDAMDVWGYSTARPITHDFTTCCTAANVTATCLPFCSLKAILDGSTEVEPSACESDFPAIVSCMADGRDHLPCCLAAGVPPACTDLCRGSYTVHTDSLRTMFSCSPYTAATLACIADGIDTLPRYPTRHPSPVTRHL